MGKTVREQESASADWQRIEDAINAIISGWDEWDAEAQQLAQVNQDEAAYFDEMRAQLAGVIVPLTEKLSTASQLAAVSKERDELREALSETLTCFHSVYFGSYIDPKIATRVFDKADALLLTSPLVRDEPGEQERP